MPSNLLCNPRQNLILGALGAEEYARLEPALEEVRLDAGRLLYESGAAIGDVYFPATSLLVLVSATRDGSSVALAITGNEGLIGVPVVLGDDHMPYDVVVQGDGHAYRLHAEQFRWELDQGRDLQRLCLRHALSVMRHMAQTAVCNRLHTAQRQLCRWLLMSLDRLPENEIRLTQAQIAAMLGRRREAVALAAAALQGAGLIAYRRGRITVLDRAGLERRACECYRAAKHDCERLQAALPESLHRHPLRPNPASLHTLAEARLRERDPLGTSDTVDVSELLRDLQLRQIELEIRNEQLAEAYATADALRHRYADIYDFSPVAYVTTDALGVIRQINLAGAILLGIRRSQVARHRFEDCIAGMDQGRFNRFLAEVLGGHAKRHCEITLDANEKRGATRVQIEAVPDESNAECRMVLSELSAEHRGTGRQGGTAAVPPG